MKTQKREIAGTPADPTLPKTPVEVGGKTYNLCFDLGALAEAEQAINAELYRAGRKDYVNLLSALPQQNLACTRIVFAAAVRKFHPELGFEAALELVGINDLLTIALAIKDAWEASTPLPAANPIPAGE